MVQRKKILVADDDPAVVRMISLQLNESQYEIISAATGKEAVAKVNQERPDLVILDYQMPEGDGIYVMTKLRTALESFTIPVIIMTAYDSTELRQRAFRLSADCVLAKPVSPAALLKEIKRKLE